MPYATLMANHEEMVENGVQFKQWQYPLLQAPCSNPVGCCYGCCCICCFAYQQRDRILTNKGIPYQPCGGVFCCFPTPEIDDTPGRECCMCCESCCCPNLAVLTNRDLIMVHYEIDYDACDEYIINCVLCLNCICTILACISEQFEDLKDLVDLLLTIIMGCSLAQQESTLDVVTGEPTFCGGNFTGGNNAAQGGYGQQQAPASYGQPTVNYGQAPVNYGQSPAANYGQPNYGQPQANYGQNNYDAQPSGQNNYAAQPSGQNNYAAQPYGAPAQQRGVGYA